MSRSVRIAAILTAALALGGCRELSFPPAGSYSHIDVLVEGGKTGEWASMLLPLLSEERNYFVSTEPRFQIMSVLDQPPSDPSSEKNIVVCGVLDPSTAVGGQIAYLLGQSGVEQVKKGQASILKLPNTPASGQLTLVVTAATDAALKKVLQDRGDEIPNIIAASCRERIRRSLLQNERKGLEDKFRRKWGFSLAVPSLYTLYNDDEAPPGVELHRESPPRVLGVFWTPWDHVPTLYNTQELFDCRAKYVYEKYDGDQMDPNRARYDYVRLGPYTAVRMSGYWYNDRYSVAGGYFETYFVWDKKEQLLWAVDCLVYAPGREKTSLVRELHALAETFRYE